MDPFVGGVTECGEKDRVGLDHVGRRVPFPGSDVPSLDHHLRTTLVASRSIALAHLGSHVGLDAHPSLESALLVPQRARIGVEPPFAAILAAHENFEADTPAGRECAADAANGFRIGTREIKQIARLAAARFRRRIPGHLGEALVDPDDAALRIVDGHTVTGGLRHHRNPIPGAFGRDFPHGPRSGRAPSPPRPNKRREEDDSQQRVEIIA